VMRMFLTIASVQGEAITSGRCSKTARDVSPTEAINVKMSFIEPHNIVTSKQCRSEFGGIYCLVSASGDGLPLQKFQVCARTKKCNSRCVATTVTSVP